MKNTKFVPFEKLSKKKQKELNNLSRNTWSIDPTTRREENGYKRHKEKDKLRKDGYEED